MEDKLARRREKNRNRPIAHIFSYPPETSPTRLADPQQATLTRCTVVSKMRTESQDLLRAAPSLFSSCPLFSIAEVLSVEFQSPLGFFDQ
jgi:hypothetical protein